MPRVKLRESPTRLFNQTFRLLALAVTGVGVLLSPSPATAAFVQTGSASWFGSENRRCATGERYSPAALTAAHRTLPFGTMVKVTNTANSRSVIVRINDRGPFVRKRVLDVSKAAARELQMINAGTARVKLEVVTGKPPMSAVAEAPERPARPSFARFLFKSRTAPNVETAGMTGR